MIEIKISRRCLGAYYPSVGKKRRQRIEIGYYYGALSPTVLGHEIAHAVLGHVLDFPMSMTGLFELEVEAWDWALSHAPKLSFDLDIFTRSITSYIENLVGEDRENAEQTVDTLLEKYQEKWDNEQNP